MAPLMDSITKRRLERHLGAAACALVIGVGSIAPTVSFAQGDTTKKSQDDGSSKTDPKAKGKKPGKQDRNKTRAAQPPSTGGLQIKPMTDTATKAAVSAGQTGPGGVQVQKGPDGKPIIVGPDGKPLTGPPGAIQTVPGGTTAPGGITTPGGPGGTTTPGANPFGGGRNAFGGGGNSFGGGRGSSGISPGGTLSMDFRGADVNNVLKFFSMWTNWQIIPDPSLTGNVTIISPKPLTVDQAFQVLQATLEIRGFTGQLTKRGDTTILKIIPIDAAVKNASVFIDSDGKFSPEKVKDQVVTQVIPVENVDAKALATELLPLMNKGASLVGSAGTNSLLVTDTASNVERIMTLVKMLDQSANSNEIHKYTLHHSDATEVSNVLNGLFTKVLSRGKAAPTGPNGQPAPPQMGPNGQPLPPQGAADRAAIVAMPDARTNSIFVVASKDNMVKVSDIINQLDDPEATALTTYIRKMRYADALDIADTINSILSGTVPQRAGGSNASFAQRIGLGGFGGGFGGFGGGGGGQGGQGQPGGVASTDPFAKIVGNARTNSLIINATPEKMEKIDDLIKQLDVEVPIEPTTFVIPLKAAQAQDIAYILSQAFGTGTQGQNNGFGGGFNFGGFGQNNNNRTSNTINRRVGTGTTGGRSVPFGPGAPNMAVQGPDGVPGVMTDQGFVPDPSSLNNPTRAAAAQFGFFGGGGGQNRQQQTPQYGRGTNGRYVNLLQLRQNVGVTADPNTNSLVITTTPDNMPYIRQLIESLDIIPRQVMIEVIIAEASLDTTNKLGFQFDAKGVATTLGTQFNQTGSSNFPVGGAGNTVSNITSTIVPGAQYGIQALSGKLNGLVQALATDNKVRILSTPKIFGSNNQEAKIDITTDIPYITGSTNNFTGGTNLSYDFIHPGITLDVTPRITPDGLVTIEVNATASEFLGFDVISTATDPTGHTTTQLAPRTSTRQTQTVVSVKDGEIVALGGLMREGTTNIVNKVPLLGDIPLIGHLFRSTNKTTNKTELMVFLIPHVVDNGAQNKAMVEKQSANIRRELPNLAIQQPVLLPEKTAPSPVQGNPGGPTEKKP
jgi:general secretion pathway protein D